MAAKTAYYGGTFDPVHNGHLIPARAAAERAGLERVVLVPAAVPPHKQGAAASGEQRLEMLRLAIADEPLFDVSDLELRRSGPSYTLATVRELTGQNGARPTLILGADMLRDLPNWYRAAEVVEAADFLVLARPGWDLGVERIERALGEHFPPAHVRRILLGVLETPRIEIASTEIRARVRSERSIRYLAPHPVVEYVERNGLYRD